MNPSRPSLLALAASLCLLPSLGLASPASPPQQAGQNSNSLSAEQATQELSLLLNKERGHLIDIRRIAEPNGSFKSQQHERIKELVERGANPNGSPLNDQLFPIAYAYQEGDWELLTWLLEHGADINHRNKYWGSVLEVSLQACEHAQFRDVERLLQLGANIHQEKRFGPFIYGSLFNTGMVEELKKSIAFLNAQGVNFNAQTSNGQTLLFTCSKEALPLLVQAGADINHRDMDGNTPLGYSLVYTFAPSSDEETLDAYLALGAKTDGVNKIGCSLLMMASISRSNSAWLDKLLQLNPPLEQQDVEGNTAYLLACASSNLVAIDKLIAAGANTKHRNKKGQDGLLCFLSSYNSKPAAWDYYQGLLKGVADINTLKDLQGNSALHCASWRGQKRIVCDIIQRGGDVNAKNNKGETPLLRASDANQQETDAILQALLAAGADPNITDEKGNSALIRNCCRDNKNTCARAEMLLKAGAQVDASNKSGRTALMCAMEQGNQELVDLLLAKGANPHAVDEEGYTALMNVCGYWYSDSSGSLDCVDMLIKAGVDVNAPAKNGKTALLFAAANDLPQQYITRLLQAGADINHKDEEGMSAILILAKEGRVSLPYLEDLCRQGASMDDKNKAGQGILELARESDDSFLLQQILAKKTLN